MIDSNQNSTSQGVNTLVVPIHTDAVISDGNEKVLDPLTDFTQLPWKGSKSAKPYIGKTVNSTSAFETNHVLQPGLHLHWTLPRVLTKSMSMSIVEKASFISLFGQSLGNQIWEILKTVPDDGESSWITLLEKSVHSAIVLEAESRKPYAKANDEKGLISSHISGITDLLDQSNFPPVPNRWIVTKKNKGAQVETKVVESDYMWPQSTENDPDGKNLSEYNSIFPVNTISDDKQPYRFVGRVVNPGNQADSKDNYLPHALTAVGFGDPSFAAFYPLSRSVFGYYDEPVNSIDSNIQYEVIGYYNNLNEDYFQIFQRAFLTQWDLEHDLKKDDNDSGINKETKHKNYKYFDLLDAIRDEFEWFIPVKIDQTGKIDWPNLLSLGWVDESGVLQPQAYHYKSFLPSTIEEKVRKEVMNTINLAIKAQLPERMICVSTHSLNENSNLPEKFPEVKVAIGNSPTEALSATIASEVCQGNKKVVEEHLEAIQFSADLEHLNLDIGPTFETLSHKKQFSDEYGGLVWTIRSQSASNNKADKSVNEYQPTLPYELGDKLNKLNIAQKCLDDTLFKIESTRERIYADWCYYLELDAEIRNSGSAGPSRGVSEQGDDSNDGDEGYGPGSGPTAGNGTDDDYGPGYGPTTDNGNENNTGPIRGEGDLQVCKELIEAEIDALNELLYENHPDSKQQDNIEKCQKLIKEEITDIESYLADFQDNSPVGTKKYTLEKKPASRFWRPNDPTILLDGFEMSPNFDVVNSSRQDGLEDCYILSDLPDMAVISAEAINNLNQAIAALKIVPGAAAIADHWHPIFMNWTVGFKQTKMYDTNGVEITKNYSPKYLTDSYSLQNPDFQLNPDKIKDPKGATDPPMYYSGRTTLMPHAGQTLNKLIAAQLAPQISNEISLSDKSDLSAWSKSLTLSGLQQANVNGGSQNTKIQYLLINNLKNDGKKISEWYIHSIEQGDVFKQFNSQGNYTLKANLTEFTDYALNAKEGKAQKIKVLHAAIYICSYNKLITTPYLSQTLSGFDEYLQSRNLLFQLPVANPFPPKGSEDFAEKVRKAVQGEGRYSQGIGVPFSPIRAGSLGITQIDLVDSFGQKHSLDSKYYQSPLLPNSLSNSVDPNTAFLTPRFAAPTRLNFCWLDAENDKPEANDYPATSPICGWLLPNNLDDSIYIYDKEGWALGYIDQGCAWRTFPGNSGPVLPEDIENKHLAKVASWICKQSRQEEKDQSKASFMTALILTIDGAMENIEPENFAQHEALSILMGQPLAVVRTSLDLETKGCYSININPDVLRNDLSAFSKDKKLHQRQTFNYETVKVPVVVGDYNRLHDGLVGYWIEEADSYRDSSFYTPYEQNKIETSQIKKSQANDIQLSLAGTAPLVLTMLVDPKAKVHAHCGVLPKKDISLPPDFYSNALKNIQVTFLTAPILSPEGAIHLSLPNEPGFEWSWLETDGNKWTEISTTGIVRKHQVETLFKAQVNNIWNLLTQLGWIKPIDERKAVVVPTDQRLTPDLDASLASMQDQLELMLSKTMINPFSPEAHFVPKQEIKEGWLKISKNNT